MNARSGSRGTGILADGGDRDAADRGDVGVDACVDLGEDKQPGVPLFVDLDGTLIRSDTLWESFISALRASPLRAVLAIGSLFSGRAALKARMFELGPVDPTTLPYRENFVEWLREQRDSGRRITLATAADRGIAEAVGGHIGIFDAVLASDGSRNMKGEAKLKAIRDGAGDGAFDYCGNGVEDLPIFAASRRAIVVAAARGVRDRATASESVDLQFADGRQGRRIALWLRAFRPHQWLKNLLVLVPLITAFRFGDESAWLNAFGALIAMCLAASGGYVVNDLLDMQVDRRHPRKRFRPFASGALEPAQGFAASALLLVTALLVGAAVGTSTVMLLLLYLTGTFAYSLWIKRIAVFDVVVLAGLYALRVQIGGAATGITVSFWLMSFSIFFFVSLALIKRCGELVSSRERDEITNAGRSYTIADLAVLQPLGIATSVAAVLVLALYVTTPDVESRYSSPQLLWLTLISVLIWLARLWLDTSRGRMHDDPLVHALKEPVARWLMLAVAGVFLLAAFWAPAGGA